LGGIFVVQISLLNFGVTLTLAARSTVFISTAPLFVALFAHFLIPGDRLYPLKVLGMILSFSGIVLIFGESFALGKIQYIPGDLVVLLSAVLLAWRLLYIKRLTQRIHPSKVLLWQTILGVPAFFALSFMFEGISYHFDWKIITAILYQGLVVAGFCFIVHTTLMRRYAASGITAFGFFSPVSGVILSNLLLGEPITIGLIVSVILVASGVTIVNLSRQ
jgi:drug/metabolite transporter (DMT)-like permease